MSSDDQDFDPKDDDYDDKESDEDYDESESQEAKPKKGKGKKAAPKKTTKKPKEPKEPKKPKVAKEPKPAKETKASKKAKAISEAKEEDDGPNPYFFPTYTASHKAEFKAKLFEVLTGLEGTDVPKPKREELRDLVFQYNMHKRPKVLQEVFDYVKEFFTETEKKEGDKLELITLMANIYESLIDTVMQPLPLIQETMFFPSKENEKRLAKVLSKAQKTLEICVFAFTNNILAEAVLGRHKAGVKVRIITDDECSKFFGADIWTLVQEGVEVTMDNHARFHMHNKFSVIDDLVLVTGSFNWTSQAVSGNQENLCVIDNQQFVKDYKAEFEKLWEQFAVNKITHEMAVKHLEEEDQEKKRRAAKAVETKRLKKEGKLKSDGSGSKNGDE